MEEEAEFYVPAVLSYVQIKKLYEMNPHGFVSDVGGGLISSSWRIFPSISVNTDSFHYKQDALQTVTIGVGVKWSYPQNQVSTKFHDSI